MAESNRSTRVAAVAGYAALVAAFLGCSDSVTAPAPVQGDASAEASSGAAADSGHQTQLDAGATVAADSRATDATPTEATIVGTDDAATADVTAATDAAPADATVSEASSDAPSTGSLDAGSSTDARVPEAEAAGPVTIPSVQMCGVLDSDWGITSDAAGCETASPNACPDRASNWASAILTNFSGAMSSDCRISQMTMPPSLSTSQSTDYGNDLLAFTMDFFGCPQPGNDAGAVTFGLIPAPLWSQVFTTTDLQVLTQLYAGAVVQALSDQSAPALSTSQLDAINAKLQALAATVPGTVTSSTLTYDTCAPDAGTEAGGDGGAADGAADSGTD
ncbi:MAG: hypothetical protein M3O36_07980 [Myxococcota bacterium]|nr:hypothetical protein [Myxococcota bacterium]